MAGFMGGGFNAANPHVPVNQAFALQNPNSQAGYQARGGLPYMHQDGFQGGPAAGAQPTAAPMQPIAPISPAGPTGMLAPVPYAAPQATQPTYGQTLANGLYTSPPNQQTPVTPSTQPAPLGRTTS